MEAPRWRAATGMGAATLVSRILGLARDAVMLALLGAGPIAGAFLTAFAVPNLFRRLFGEGVLSSVAVPVMTSADRDQPTGLWALLRAILHRLTWYLGGVIAVLMVLFAGASIGLPEGSRVGLTLAFGAVMLPYAVLVCLAAMMAAALQVRQHFALPAWSPVLLNCVLLATMGLAASGPADEPLSVAWILCGGVLLGGALQWALGIVLIRRTQSPAEPRSHPQTGDHLREIFRLLGPGVLGAAAFQLNVLGARVFALAADASGAAWFYMANRLVELPIGIIAVAINTVSFTAFAHAAAAGERVRFHTAFWQAAFLQIVFTLPAAIGLTMLAEPVLALLFGYGRTTTADITSAANLLQWLAPTIVLGGLAGLATRALHAHKAMKAVARAAWGYVAVQTALSLLLISPFGVQGIAMAHLLASTGYLFALCYLLRTKLASPAFSLRATSGMTVALAAIVGIVLGVRAWFGAVASAPWPLLLTIAVAATVYLLLLWIFGVRGWMALLRRSRN